jgi:hypothetical protein
MWYKYWVLVNSLADESVEKGPIVRKRVDEELLPLWLSQRGLDSKEI